MSEAPVATVEQNGKPPAPQAQLPEGTLTLPPALTARITAVMQETPAIRDMLIAYVEGKGAAMPLALVVPVVLLMPPQPGQGG